MSCLFAKETSIFVFGLARTSDDLYKRLGLIRGAQDSIDPVYAAIQETVDKVNKEMQPYARISRITILLEALEMTTTKKVKRNFDHVQAVDTV